MAGCGHFAARPRALVRSDPGEPADRRSDKATDGSLLSDPIVGIDLGTSNSVVAYADATGNVTVLADDAGYKIHPSVVSFHPNGGVVVGAAAKQRKVIDPQNTSTRSSG